MLAFLALSTILGAATAQTCTTGDCVANCAKFAVINTHCGFDYQPNDNIQTCLCQYTYGLQGNLDVLNRCVACDQDGLISGISLSQFQGQEAICAKYAASGENAALSVAAAAPSAVVAAFSATNLPQIRSAYCGEAVTTSTTPAPSPSKAVAAEFTPGALPGLAGSLVILAAALL